MTTLSQFTGAIRSPSVQTTNDLTIDANGVLAVSTGRYAYADIITDAVRTILGEIQLDTMLGTDYFGTVFSSVMKQAEWRSIVQDKIESYDFVLGVLSFDTSYSEDSHTLSYKIVIQTDDGDVTVEG